MELGREKRHLSKKGANWEVLCWKSVPYIADMVSYCFWRCCGWLIGRSFGPRYLAGGFCPRLDIVYAAVAIWEISLAK